MKIFRCFMLASLLTTASCRQTGANYPQYPLIQSRTKLFHLIETQPLSPTPIRLDLKNLPAPLTTKTVSKPPKIVSIPRSPLLRVPAGFIVNIYAEGLNAPRWLALTPENDVLVTETKKNRISLLHSSKNNGVADIRQIFANAANGLRIPFGMAFSHNYFYLGNTNLVLRFAYKKGQKQLFGAGEKIADLPGGGYNQHWTRNVVVSPDGQKLYVAIGSSTNVSEEELPRASVQQMNLDGSQKQTFAFGLRNPVGLDFQPITHELYATVNERDNLGDDLVPDYLTHLHQGEFYGWPYAYLIPQNLDPRQLNNHRSKRPDLVAKTRTPDVLFTAHSAPLGLYFYRGRTFPQKYHNGAFVAFRGSWNRDRATGYKIVFVPFDAKGYPKGYYEDFLTGFLLDPKVPTAWGRPVGLLGLPDGSLLVTEEVNNRIYRVQYQPRSLERTSSRLLG